MYVTLFKCMVESQIEPKALLDKIFISISEAVFVVDHVTHTILLCNPVAERMFGYTQEEMIGHSTELLHVNQATREEFVKTYQDG